MRGFTIDYRNKIISENLRMFVEGYYSSLLSVVCGEGHLWRLATTEARKLPSQFDRLYQDS